jgi:hypothetical protein
MTFNELIYYAEICNLSYKTAIPDTFLDFKSVKLNDFHSTYVLILQNENEICFTFRGTSSLYNLKQDMLFFKTDFIINNVKLGKIHSGFLEYYNNAKEKLFKILKTYLSIYPNCNKIILTGHSLGGCILLFGLELIVLFPELQSKINIITFASPRIGNFKFKNNCDNLISNYLRVVNSKDLIPKLPSRILFYSHTKNVLLLNKQTMFQSMKTSIINFYCESLSMLKNFNDLIFNAQINHSIIEYISLLQDLNEEFNDNKYKNLFDS